MAHQYPESGAFDRLVDDLRAAILAKRPKRQILVKSIATASPFKQPNPAPKKAPRTKAALVDLVTRAVISGRLSGCDGEIALAALAADKSLDAGLLTAIGAEI